MSAQCNNPTNSSLLRGLILARKWGFFGGEMRHPALEILAAEIDGFSVLFLPLDSPGPADLNQFHTQISISWLVQISYSISKTEFLKKF